jgi:hypothetical protein
MWPSVVACLLAVGILLSDHVHQLSAKGENHKFEPFCDLHTKTGPGSAGFRSPPHAVAPLVSKNKEKCFVRR